MSVESNVKKELLDLYDDMLESRANTLRESYNMIFGDVGKKILNESYRTYYAKVHMKQAYVYFIYNKVTKLTKIGKSADPFKRLKELNSLFVNHFGLADSLEMLRIVFVPSGNDYKVEHLFHEKFNDYRVHGEWFNIDRDVIFDLLPEFISYDSDGLLENEGFDEFSYEMIDDFNLYMFALDSMDDIIFHHVKNNNRLALMIKKLVADELIYKKFDKEYYGFFNFDVRTWDSLFSGETQNKTWEMFKWLLLNKDKYSLSSFYHMNKDGNVKKRVFGFNKDAEILDYYTLVEDIIYKNCYK
ncbi:MAG: GIY-YIG nuclease family protein [Clostridiales bacterium]|nr:GIY-YIG nuclease family protein [Clostridiales bacterium]